MGYTNYLSKKNTKTSPEAEDKAFRIGRKILEDYSSILASGNGDVGSAPAVIGLGKEDRSGFVAFNGIGDQSHETAMLFESINAMVSDFEFCKTNYKEYDKIVVAIYSLMDYLYDGALVFSSDGDEMDVEEGMRIAATAIVYDEFHEKMNGGQEIEAIGSMGDTRRYQEIIESMMNKFKRGN